MDSGQWFVEGGQASTVPSSQTDEIGVGDLPVAAYVSQVDVPVGERVGPERAPRMAVNTVQDSPPSGSGLPDAQQEPDERTLDDGADGESL